MSFKLYLPSFPQNATLGPPYFYLDGGTVVYFLPPILPSVPKSPTTGLKFIQTFLVTHPKCILILVLACSLLHTMAGLQSTHLVSSSIFHQHHPTQALLHLGLCLCCSLFLNYSSHLLFTWKSNLFSKTILKPPPKAFGNPSACTCMWHTSL